MYNLQLSDRKQHYRFSQRCSSRTGVGFEIVGSRIIFSEIPRVGSTFVAFSYVGSEADVDAAEVVPPIEPGDFIEIQGETTDREVALIESSNSLITFDYLGSVFGQDGQASAQLTSGFIDKVQVTSGGSGYTSRPTVRLDSISGFDGQIRALVGVAGVELQSAGSGYQNPQLMLKPAYLMIGLPLIFLYMVKR